MLQDFFKRVPGTKGGPAAYPGVRALPSHLKPPIGGERKPYETISMRKHRAGVLCPPSSALRPGLPACLPASLPAPALGARPSELQPGALCPGGDLLRRSGGQLAGDPLPGPGDPSGGDSRSVPGLHPRRGLLLGRAHRPRPAHGTHHPGRRPGGSHRSHRTHWAGRACGPCRGARSCRPHGSHGREKGCATHGEKWGKRMKFGALLVRMVSYNIRTSVCP